MKEKKEIKRDLLDKFRANGAEAGDTLPGKWLEAVYLPRLSSEEKKLFKKAVQELVAIGILEPVEGADLNLRLTGKGEHLLYGSESARSLREAETSREWLEFSGNET